MSTSSVPQHDTDDIRADRVAHLGGILRGRGATLAVAESLTGGLLVQVMAKAEGSSEWLRGGVVAYATGVKHDLLGVTASNQICQQTIDAAVDRLLDVLDQ